ncbi:hypothetical protein CLOM_g5802 [Closterium sp. NIES-68]|nr:hypothetical protein CLOM_g5802 [Closterium sp. NIES-68]GJP73858.1 hypothetical protein CLOP_g4533 [Closterium sp. NIES-67]
MTIAGPGGPPARATCFGTTRAVSCLPIGRHSRPQENFSTFPENTDFGFDHAAAHAFASSAAQESCSSHLIHRGWCTASRGTHLPAPPSASGHYNCNSSSACGVVKSYSTSFEVNSIGCSGFSSSSTGSSSGSSSSSSSKYTISHARGSFVAVDDVPEKGQVQRHSRFRVRGRAVVTVEDMVFGRGETTLA